jgi:hypothetical protein
MVRSIRNASNLQSEVLRRRLPDRLEQQRKTLGGPLIRPQLLAVTSTSRNGNLKPVCRFTPTSDSLSFGKSRHRPCVPLVTPLA